MLKKIAVLALIFSAVTLLALAPMSVSASAADTYKLQTTEEPPVVGVTVVVAATSTPGTIPVTGGGGLPMSTVLIFALVAILGIAVVIGGISLLNRQ